jgi:hypothetical protein
MDFVLPSRDDMIKELHDYCDKNNLKKHYNRNCLSDDVLKKIYLIHHNRFLLKLPLIDRIKHAYGDDSGMVFYEEAVIAWNDHQYQKSFELYKKSANLGFELSYSDVAQCYHKYYYLFGINENKELAIEYYARYLKAVRDKVVFDKTFISEIPQELLTNIITKQWEYETYDKYGNYKQYCKISDKLKDVIPIGALREIVLEYV